MVTAWRIVIFGDWMMHGAWASSNGDIGLLPYQRYFVILTGVLLVPFSFVASVPFHIIQYMKRVPMLWSSFQCQASHLLKAVVDRTQVLTDWVCYISYPEYSSRLCQDVESKLCRTGANLLPCLPGSLTGLATCEQLIGVTTQILRHPCLSAAICSSLRRMCSLGSARRGSRALGSIFCGASLPLMHRTSCHWNI
jgi:hypothetical protein